MTVKADIKTAMDSAYGLGEATYETFANTIGPSVDGYVAGLAVEAGSPIGNEGLLWNAGAGEWQFQTVALAGHTHDDRYYTEAETDSLLALRLLITDIDDTPVNGVTNAPISSNWAFDHVAAADPHIGYRLESVDHSHQSTGAQAGQLDHGLALTNIGVLTHANHDTLAELLDGTIVETIDVAVDASGGDIQFTLQGDGATDLTVVKSTGLIEVDTTPALSVILTAGTATVPQINYVYLNDSQVLTASAVGFPATFHAPVATVMVLDRATTDANGALKVHEFTNHLSDVDSGDLVHITKRIRAFNSTWISGTALTPTPAVSGSGATMSVAVATGSIYQLHPHTYPALDGAVVGHHVVNDNTTPYTKVTDLGTIVLDADGGSLTNKHYSMVVWGVISEATGDCHIMVNMPTGSYNTQAKAERDADKYTVYTIPVNFVGAAFLIARLTVKNTTDSSFTMNAVEDLRGQIPSQAAGGGAGVTSHSDLADLTNDDHSTTYPHLDGSRPFTGAVTIDGSADTNQLVIQANATQANSNPLILLEANGGTDIMSITSDHVSNIFIGIGAGNDNSVAGADGVENIFIGQLAGTANIIGASNVVIGQNAFITSSSGDKNTVIGCNALQLAISNHCTAIGFEALEKNTAAFLTAVGSLALTQNTTGASNVAMGVQALGTNTTGTANLAVGYRALFSNLDSDFNVAIGYKALEDATSQNNIAIGSQALTDCTSGSGNVAIGALSLLVCTQGLQNMAIGTGALAALTTGDRNIGIGTSAGKSLSTADANIAIGYLALEDNTASHNTAIGSEALLQNTSGAGNLGIGYQALQNNVTGGNNTCIGYQAGLGVAANSFSNNTIIGYTAGLALTTGSTNVLIGTQTGDNLTTGGANILIGFDIAASAAGVSNELNIGGLLKGDLSTPSFAVHADAVQIVTSQSPASGGAGVAGEIAWDANFIYVCTAANTWTRAALTGGY